LIALVVFLTGVFIALFATADPWDAARQAGAQVAMNHVPLASSANVHEAWVRRYNGPGNGQDYATAMTIDASGNVYVTGASSGSGTDLDYAMVKYNSAGQRQWVARYNGSTNSVDVPFAIAVDGSGNIYVTGGAGDDFATIKYNSAGQQQWVARYDGPANSFDTATTIAVDNSAAVYVTGISDAFDTGSDYATIKYNATGQREWVARYAGPDNTSDHAYAMAVDTSGNVYVTGESSPGYATVKYNSAGQQQWVVSYNHDGYATAIAVDSSGNVYVTGATRGFGQGYDYATVKYNSAGQEQWVARYDGPGPGYSTDQAAAIALDALGNVYVTGYSVGSGTDVDYATIKYVQEAAPTPTPTPTPTAWPTITPRPLPTFPPRPTRPPRLTTP